MKDRNRTTLIDPNGRTINYARIAVTSRCNLCCSYCRSERHETSVQAHEEMSSLEIGTIIEVLASLGITKLRFTGGEPLLCRDIVQLIHKAKQVGIATVALTTNGVLLDRYFSALVDAGLDALNLSIDSLDRQLYYAITRHDVFDRVHKNLEWLLNFSPIPIKLNTVVMRDVNSNDIHRFIALTKEYPITVRFIELQPFDDHQVWRTGKFLGAHKIVELLRKAYPDMQQVHGNEHHYESYTIPHYKGSFTLIPAYTRNFCNSCNKIRLTHDGTIRSCLYENEGVPLLPLLRAHASHEALVEQFHAAILTKPIDGKHAAGSTVRTSMSEIGG